MENIFGSDAVKVYRNDIELVKEDLSYKDNDILFNELKSTREQNKAIANKIVEANLQIVLHEVTKAIKAYGTTYRISVEDLIQEGNIGLMIAVNKYDNSLEYSFYTYAKFWVNGAIRRYIYKNNSLVNIPENVAIEISKVSSAIHTLRSELCREPKDIEISKFTRLTKPRVIFIKGYLESYKDSSIDILLEVSSNDESTLVDIAIENETKITLKTLICMLPEMYQTVIILRYGLYAGAPLTYDEIGEHLGKSKQRAHQIHNDAIVQLQNIARRCNIRI